MIPADWRRLITLPPNLLFQSVRAVQPGNAPTLPERRANRDGWVRMTFLTNVPNVAAIDGCNAIVPLCLTSLAVPPAVGLAAVMLDGQK